MLGNWLARLPLTAPGLCDVCGAWPAQAVCDACRRRFAARVHRCARCALPVHESIAVCGTCTREPPPLLRCHAAVSYGYPWARLLTRCKFGGQPGTARTLARVLAAAPGVAEEAAGCDLVLPMPLSRERLLSRGFNQALLLARGLARDRTDATLLLRLRDTAPQTSLGRAQREANVRGAFGVDPLRVHEVAGRRVLLVDDVMTSGASLFAAARALLSAGCAGVCAAVVARTDEPAR